MAFSSPTARLLVDGYNMIGAWPSLSRVRDRDGLESARYELIEVLTNYSAFRGYETRLVFDAYIQNSPGSQEVVTQHLAVYYTDFGQTADSYIEKTCAQFKSGISRSRTEVFPTRLIVATSDRAQQLTVIGYGAEWMSARQLESDVHSSFQSIKQRQANCRRIPSRSLMHTLDQRAKEQLTKLRFGIK